MKNNRLFRFLMIGMAILMVLLLVTYVVLTLLARGPESSMHDHITNEVTETRNHFMVEPTDPFATLVLYPGALVEAESYLLLGDMLAREGMRVIIPKMPLNFAILNRYAFNDYYEEGHPWFLGGHSLGGASASYVADSYPERLEGLILIASYTPSSIDLSETALSVLSITAELDGVIDTDALEIRESLLPADTTHARIDGANHAQFGYYGTQRADKEAEISVLEQHEITTGIIMDFVYEVMNKD